MEWAESGNDRIVAESRFHIENTLRYFVDGRPKNLIYKPQHSWEEELRQANQTRKQTEKITNQTATKHRKPFRVARTGLRW
jgi:hypothetical protein